MTEAVIHPARRLGRRPPKHADSLRLGHYLTGQVPPHPTAADDLGDVSTWEMGGNDQFGTCGPTSVANQRHQVVTYLAPGGALPTLDDVFDLYRRSGNPDFDPATGEDDNGVDMQTMLEALVAGGIGGVKPLAFASVDHTNLDEVRAAVDLFGGLLLGVNLEVAQQAQTDQGLWDFRSSGEWGGHAILAGSYTSAARGRDIAVVTWTEIVGTTDAFEAHQLDEAWVVIWPEHLTSARFQAGIDLATLAADYQELTGQPFPAVVPPAPAPGPTPPPPQPTPPAPTPVPPAVLAWLEQEVERLPEPVRDWLEAVLRELEARTVTLHDLPTTTTTGAAPAVSYFTNEETSTP